MNENNSYRDCLRTKFRKISLYSHRDRNAGGTVQVNVSGHHLEVTDALRSYVDTKLERLERHFDRITNVNVILRVEKQRQKAEATIRISGGEVFADAEADDLYSAIDLLADKLDRQLIKRKEKSKDRKQRG